MDWAFLIRLRSLGPLFVRQTNLAKPGNRPVLVVGICRHRARRPQAHKNMRATQEIGERVTCSATPIVGRLAAKDVDSHRNATSCAAGVCRRAVHQLPRQADFAVLSRVVGGALAGAGGIEPPNGGIKIRCLTAWLRPNRLNRNARGRYPLREPVRTTPGL